MTNEYLHRNTVLVLNRNWQAIDITSPAQAFCHLSTDTATALDIGKDGTMNPLRWEEWLLVDIRDHDFAIHTSSLRIRVPTVLVLTTFCKVPMKQPKFSSRTVRERDANRCQYSGTELAPDEGNIDHVIPRSRGGKTTWTNCVWSSKKINTRKGDKTPSEAGLKLLKKPVAPREVPVTATLKNKHGIPDWDPFLISA